MRENVIESYLVKCVEAVGGLAVKFTSSNNRGVPDRMCVFPSGILVFVECKAPGKTLDPLQKIWFRRLQERGHLCIMIDSREKVLALIRWYERKVSDASNGSTP